MRLRSTFEPPNLVPKLAVKNLLAVVPCLRIGTCGTSKVPADNQAVVVHHTKLL